MRSKKFLGTALLKLCHVRTASFGKVGKACQIFSVAAASALVAFVTLVALPSESPTLLAQLAHSWRSWRNFGAVGAILAQWRTFGAVAHLWRSGALSTGLAICVSWKCVRPRRFCFSCANHIYAQMADDARSRLRAKLRSKRSERSSGARAPPWNGPPRPSSTTPVLPHRYSSSCRARGP